MVQFANAALASVCLAILSFLAAEWIHFTLFGIILPTIKLKCILLGAYELSNQVAILGFIRTLLGEGIPENPNGNSEALNPRMP